MIDRLPDEPLQQRREQLRRLAWLLDSSIGIPGTRFRFGVDALLGLVPFLGDAAGVLLSSYIVLEAARMGVPRALLVRMGANVAIEGLVGAIPLLGDLFDAAWKANQRNVRLLEAHFGEAPDARRQNVRWATAIVAALVVLLVLAGALAFVTLRALWNLVAS
jgi:hypothetical protein